MGTTPEATVTKTIMRHLERLRPHGFFVKIHGGPMQRAGIPDIVGVYRGRFLSFEVKMPGGKVRPLQSYMLKLVRHAGGIAEVVYGWEDCRKIIEDLDRGVLT